MGKWWPEGGLRAAIRRRWKILLLLGISALVATGANLLAWDPSTWGWQKYLAASLTGVAYIVAAGLTVWVDRERLRQEAATKKKTATQHVNMIDKLRPLLEKAQVATSSKTPSAQRKQGEQLATKLIEAVPAMLGKESGRLRCCWYGYRKDGTRRLLECKDGDYSGRSTRPNRSFEAGSCDRDDFVFKVMDNRSTSLAQDTENDPPPHWDSERDRDYQSYCMAAVWAADKPVGLLIVDSQEPFGLTLVDEYVIRLLATIMGIAYSLQMGNRKDRNG